MNDEDLPRFCTGCGAPYSPGAAFCTSCGRALAPSTPAALPDPVAPAPPTAPVPPVTPTPQRPTASPTGEWVMSAVAGLTYKQGLMGLKRTNYALVATNLRLLFVELTADMLKKASMDARDQAKADGKGFFRQWGAQLGGLHSFGDRFGSMTVEQILAHYPSSWSLDRNGIKKSKLRRGSPGDDESASTPDSLLLKCADGKYTFEVSDYRRTKEALTTAGLL